MSYESYKVLHLAAIFVFLSSASVMLVARPAGAFWKMLTGISSLVILIGGMGLVAKLLHGAMPGWVVGKLVIWLIVTGLGHVIAKRFPKQGGLAMGITLGLAAVAAWLAVFKPF